VPDFQVAIRNNGYKLAQIGTPNCSAQPDPTTGQFPDVTLNEFYQINEATPVRSTKPRLCRSSISTTQPSARTCSKTAL
jgi:hypothetical protein